jgi:hypothetical protein
VCANTSNFCVGQFLLAASQVSRLSATNATKDDDDVSKTDDDLIMALQLAPAPPAPGCASIKASATVRNKQRGLFGAIFEYGTKTITFPRQAQDTYLDLHSTQKVENPRRLVLFCNQNHAIKDFGKKTALFEPFIYKMHYFTKTGSGRT